MCQCEPSPFLEIAGTASTTSILSVVKTQYGGTMRSNRRSRNVFAACVGGSEVEEVIITKPLTTKKISTPVEPPIH